MARRIRIQYPGAFYHVVSRGDRDGAIFVDDGDRKNFLKTLDEARAKTLWGIHAYVLMPDHFHLVIQTPEANLVAGMQWFLGTYTTRYNVRHGLRGHLFAGRYKATPIDPEGEYLRTAVDYVHLNPARAKLIQEHEPLRGFRWSSFGSYLDPGDTCRTRPGVDPALTAFNASNARMTARDVERHTEWRRTMDLNAEFQGLRHGWFFGGESFRAELLARLQAESTAHHLGPEIHQSAEARAERIVARELSLLHWSEQNLRERAKGALEKIRIAERLRMESTMTLGWIANRLKMGTTGHLSHLLYWRRRGAKPGRRPKAGVARAATPSVRSESKGSPAGSPGKPPVRAGLVETPIPPAEFQPFVFDTAFD